MGRLHQDFLIRLISIEPLTSIESFVHPFSIRWKNQGCEWALNGEVLISWDLSIHFVLTQIPRRTELFYISFVENNKNGWVYFPSTQQWVW